MSDSITVNNFDTNKALYEQVRAVTGPIKTGTVAYDVDFLDENSNPVYCRWLYIGTTGNLAYMKWDGLTETLPNIASGVWHPIYAKRILSTGSTVAANQIRWGM